MKIKEYVNTDGTALEWTEKGEYDKSLYPEIAGSGGGYEETLIWENSNSDGTLLVGTNNNVEDVSYDISGVVGENKLWELFDWIKIDYAVSDENFSMMVDPNIANGKECTSSAALYKNTTSNFGVASKYNGLPSYYYANIQFCSTNVIRVYTTATSQPYIKIFNIIGLKSKGE